MSTLRFNMLKETLYHKVVPASGADSENPWNER